MEYLIALIFGLIGGVIGFLIPNLSNQIITFKLAQRDRQREKNMLDQRKWILLVMITNSMLWGIAGYLTTSIILGLLIGCLVTMAIMFTFIDIIIHLIPNEMIITGLAVGIVFQILMFGFNHIWIPLLSMVVITVIFTVVGLIIGLKKIGAGDVKLAGLMGLILGYPYVVYAIIAMSIALIIYSIVGITIGKLTHVSMVAFAPFLMIGLLTGLMVMLIPSLIL